MMMMYSEQKLEKKVMAIVNNILQIGRHFNVSICFTTHLQCAGNETKILLSEANIIVVFPRTTGSRALKYLLDNYLGMDLNKSIESKALRVEQLVLLEAIPLLYWLKSQFFLLMNFKFIKKILY